jgi:hypothetical protein
MFFCWILAFFSLASHMTSLAREIFSNHLLSNKLRQHLTA